LGLVGKAEDLQRVSSPRDFAELLRDRQARASSLALAAVNDPAAGFPLLPLAPDSYEPKGPPPMKPRTTVEAVELYLANRRADPRFAGPDAVAAASALRLAAVLDTSDSGSGAANASRELRQQLELLRLTEEDPLPSAEDLVAERQSREAERVWDNLRAELSAAVEASSGTEETEPPPAFGY
jgi:hypothetical protein